MKNVRFLLLALALVFIPFLKVIAEETPPETPPETPTDEECPCGADEDGECLPCE